MTLYVGSAQSHIGISLGLTSPPARYAFGTTVGLLLLLTLPLLTRACVAVQARLGQALLWDECALHRRISGLEQERDTARAQTVAAVTAEAAALRRLERDIHDGPQQRLVRLAMELGRAQRHLDSRPEAAREALANVAKHSQARRCAIGLRHDEGTLRAWVTDDGVGGAALDKGHGLRGLDDRVHAIGGRLRVTSPRGGPTTVTAELPCR
jgi:signal transduction histidine kinase